MVKHVFFFALSRDGMIPAGICKIHKLYRTPYLVTIGGCILVSIIAGFAPIHLIAEMANIGTLSAFFIAGFGVLYLRIKTPRYQTWFQMSCYLLCSSNGYDLLWLFDV